MRTPPQDPELAEIERGIEQETSEIRRLEALGPATPSDLLKAARAHLAQLRRDSLRRRSELAEAAERSAAQESENRSREVAASEKAADSAMASAREAGRSRTVALWAAVATVLFGAPALYVAWTSAVATRAQAESSRRALELTTLQNRATEENELEGIRETLAISNSRLVTWVTFNSFADSEHGHLARLLEPSNLFLDSEAAALGLRVERALPRHHEAASVCERKVQALARAGRLARSGRFSPESLSAVLKGPTAAFIADELVRCLVEGEPLPGNRALFMAAYFFGPAASSGGHQLEPRRHLSADVPDGLEHLISALSLKLPAGRPAPYSPTREDLSAAVFGFGGCNGYVRDVGILADPEKPGIGGVELTFTSQWSDGPGADIACFEWKPPVSGGRLAFGFSKEGDTVLSVDIPGLGSFEARVASKKGRYVPSRPVHIEAYWNLGALTPARSLRLVVDKEEAKVVVPDRVLFRSR